MVPSLTRRMKMRTTILLLHYPFVQGHCRPHCPQTIQSRHCNLVPGVVAQWWCAWLVASDRRFESPAGLVLCLGKAFYPHVALSRRRSIKNAYLVGRKRLVCVLCVCMNGFVCRKWQQACLLRGEVRWHYECTDPANRE